MSCYMPVLERFIRKHGGRREEIHLNERNSSHLSVLETDSVLREEEVAYPLPKRDPQGFTITQELGNFPHERTLNIRHDHPTLGLSDVAYQRLHQGHIMNPAQYEKLQSQLRRGGAESRDSSPKMRLRKKQGVLSLGLPENMNLFRKSRPNTPVQRKKRNEEEDYDGFTSESSSIKDHRPSENSLFEEISSAKRTKTKSPSSSSGLSSGSRSPDNHYSGINSDSSPPPPLAPKGMPNVPPPVYRRFPPRIFRNQEIADHHGVVRRNEESSSASSSAAESDSIGSARNSSPEISKPPPGVHPALHPHLHHHHHQYRRPPMLMSKESRLSPRCEFSSPTKGLESRLSPSVYGGLFLNHQKQQLLPPDMGYHSLNNTSRISNASSLEARSSPDPWDVRATKASITDLKPPQIPILQRKGGPSFHPSRVSLDSLPDDLLVKIFSFLSSNEIVRLSRVNRRFYFSAWDPTLWNSVSLTGENTDADLGIKTIFRLLSRNSAGGSSKLSLNKISLNGCRKLTDRGLAIVARRCPQLKELEIQHCVNITNGGLMDLVSKCHLLDHLDVTGCQMISTISVHQPPPSPRQISSSNFPPQPQKRQLNIQYLDLSDCVSLEDSGLKMIVESCPQLTYLFLRRCSNITDMGIKFVSSYCLCLRELSISDCVRVTDYGLYELAKLGPNLRYLSVAKCDRITDAGIKQLSRLCYKLRYLNVRGCESISDEALETVSRSCSRLRSLDIGKCDVTDSGLQLLAENCPNLKKLSVKSCEMVNDKGIQTVAYYCRGLQQLNIQDTPVTLEGYRAVKKFCRRCLIEHSHPGFH